MSPPNKNLKYVHAYKDRHGKIRYYYRRNHKQVAIKGEFGERVWLDNYSSIHDRFEANLYPRVDSGTFAAAVSEYYRSPRFGSLKPKTQDNYRRALMQLVESFGNIRLQKITRGGLVKLRDQLALKSPRRAIEAIKVVSLVFECARDLDLADHNPAKEISRPLGYQADPHRPWSHNEIETFLGNCRPV